MKWDVFLSHAYEDKKEIADPLHQALVKAGLTVWYDKTEIELGDSLRAKMDEGLSHARFGVVVISPTYFKKHWSIQEMNALFQREVDGKKVILPLWHGISRAEVAAASPLLSDRMAARWSDGIEKIVEQIVRVVGKSQPATSETAKPQSRKKSNLVMIVGKNDGHFGAFPLKAVSRSDKIQLQIIADDDQSSSRLNTLLNSSSNAEFAVTYRRESYWTRLIKASQDIKDANEIWTVELMDMTARHGLASEMAYNGYSADDLASMRARYILLAEEPKDGNESTREHGFLKDTFFKIMVTGTGSALKAVPIYDLLTTTMFNVNPETYCDLAELVAVMTLKLSGTVGEFWTLDIKPAGPRTLTVDFKGKRPKYYANIDPPVIAVNGVVDLDSLPVKDQ